jgi:hypothetical protein
MASPTRFSLSLVACLATGIASAEGAAEVPPQLRAGDGETLAMTLQARGVQVYECRAVKGSQYAYEWALVAPEAQLRDAQGQLVGRHYAGPRWEASDGSRIIGAVKTRADAPQADAIPWLLLAAKPDGGDGAFSKISSVQRVNTTGGVAPASGCSEATVGAPARVDYTADYRMYVPR